ncbi:MAG: DUF4160 domain-containing protein [Phycisphaeraceae bacterium]
MPEISRFFGIVIQMYFDEHGPPHFHARYSGMSASISIDPIEVMNGTLPPRAESMVLEWTALHQRELLENWHRLRNGAAAAPIAPLK